jgi:hypothetical protein
VDDVAVAIIRNNSRRQRPHIFKKYPFTLRIPGRFGSISTPLPSAAKALAKCLIRQYDARPLGVPTFTRKHLME